MCQHDYLKLHGILVVALRSSSLYVRFGVLQGSLLFVDIALVHGDPVESISSSSHASNCRVPLLSLTSCEVAIVLV